MVWNSRRCYTLHRVEGNPQTVRSDLEPTCIRFGLFELDVRAAELRKGGTRIQLQDQPLQILLMLLARPGDVVLREEIRNKLWPGDTVVEFDAGINAAVKRLRDALRESAAKPRHIETLARRGYRFVGQIEPVSPEMPQVSAVAQGSATAAPPAADRDPRREFPPVRILLTALLATILLVALGGVWSYRHGAPARWARNVALPEATRLIDAGRYAPALSFLLRAQRVMPEDPTLMKLRREISHPFSIRTYPSGASIWVKAYEDPDGEWLPLGQSPIENFLLPLAYFRWRIAKKGFRTLEAGAGYQADAVEFHLDPEGSSHPEMVHVPAGTFQLLSLSPVQLDDYWMDTYEVTNRQFKQFIDKGGYSNRQHWRERFLNQGRVLAWEEAMAEFHDGTGRPGPSTGELSDYPPGHDDFPVNGVSWYEAAAYAEFAHKQLPTIYHWYRAANLGIHSDILMFSNFDGSGPARVGIHPGLGPFGTYDMAGNVREWCWNATGNRRYLVGGAWNDPRYAYSSTKAVLPFDRSPTNGFRCVTYPGPVRAGLTGPIEKPARDHGTEDPVTDREFRILQSFYSYDHTGLKTVTESVDESSRDWKMEKIGFDAAYGNQRVTARLYLPRNAKPPYETIFYFPPRSALSLRNIDDFEVRFIGFLVKTGRAVLYPVYQGMYERRLTAPVGPSGERDRVIEQSKDLRRSLDYLETRPDIDLGRVGYYGISDGARLGLIQLAEESRIRAAVLSAGGLSPERKPLEIDEINLAPRVRIPVLMLNGRYDFMYAAESDQIQMFRLLGTPEKDKRYVLFNSGHVPIQQQEVKETLDWFDRYLGPVRK